MRTSLPAALRLLAAAAAVVALAGCTIGAPSSADPGASPVPAPSAPPTTDAPGEDPASPAPAPVVEPVAVDWNDPLLEVPLPAGWTLRDCEGDAPLLCIHDGATVLGAIESMRYPLDDELADILEADGIEAALRHHAAAYHETFASDRAEGCGDGYRYVEHPTEVVEVAGAPGVRYGFSGMDADGTEVERNVIHATILDGHLQLVATLSNTTASCVWSDAVTELTPAQLRQLEPSLDAIAAGSVLPE